MTLALGFRVGSEAVDARNDSTADVRAVIFGAPGAAGGAPD